MAHYPNLGNEATSVATWIANVGNPTADQLSYLSAVRRIRSGSVASTLLAAENIRGDASLLTRLDTARAASLLATTMQATSDADVSEYSTAVSYYSTAASEAWTVYITDYGEPMRTLLLDLADESLWAAAQRVAIAFPAVEASLPGVEDAVLAAEAALLALEPELGNFQASLHYVDKSAGAFKLVGAMDPVTYTDGNVGPEIAILHAALTLVESTSYGDGYVPPAVTGTIDSVLTLLDAMATSDDYTSPPVIGEIDAYLPALDGAIEAWTSEPIPPVTGTIDDAALTLVDASIEAELLPHIYGDLTLLTSSIDAGILVEGTVEVELPLIEPTFEVRVAFTDGIHARIPKIKASLGGNINIVAKLTGLKSDISSLRGTPVKIEASIPRIVPKVTGNFNLKATLPRMRSQVNALAGKTAKLASALPVIRSLITGRVDAVIRATLPKSRAVITAIRGVTGTVSGGLTLLSSGATSGAGISGRLPIPAANIDVRANVVAGITAKLPAVTSAIRDVSSAAVGAELLVITSSIDALCSAPARVSARLFPPTARITTRDIMTAGIDAAIPAVRANIKVIRFSGLPKIDASLSRVVAELVSDASGGVSGTVGTVAITLPRVAVSMVGQTAAGGVVSARLTRVNSTAVAIRGNVGQCVSAIPKTVRARMQAAQGVRAGIDAKLKVIKSNLR